MRGKGGSISVEIETSGLITPIQISSCGKGGSISVEIETAHHARLALFAQLVERVEASQSRLKQLTLCLLSLDLWRGKGGSISVEIETFRPPRLAAYYGCGKGGSISVEIETLPQQPQHSTFPLRGKGGSISVEIETMQSHYRALIAHSVERVEASQSRLKLLHGAILSI